MSLDENTPDARRFPIMGGRDRALKSVDWSVAEQAREQALTNHGQTLEQLAARGGLDARELLAAAVDPRRPILNAKPNEFSLRPGPKPNATPTN